MADVLQQNLGLCINGHPYTTIYFADHYAGSGAMVDPILICDICEEEELIGFTGVAEADLSNLDPATTIDVDLLVGEIPDENLAAIDATKIIGQLTDAQLEAISLAKVLGEIGGGNLVTNSSAEVNTTGWAVAATAPATGTLTRQTNITPKHGAAVFRTVTGTAGDVGVWNDAARPPIAAGRAHTASIWVRPSAVRTVRISLEIYDVATGGTALQTFTADFASLPATTWSRITVTGVPSATSSARWARISTRVVGTAAAETSWWDAAQLEEGEKVTAYHPRPDEILPGAVFEEHLVAGAVTAGKISVVDLAAITAALGTVTSGKYTARGDPGSGAGFEMDSAGFRAYNSSNEQTYNLRATTGKVVVGAGPSIADGGSENAQRVEIDRAGMRMYGISQTTFDLAWVTEDVANPPGTGSTVSRGQMSTPIPPAEAAYGTPVTDLEQASRLWFDELGLHSQLKLGNGLTPFRTFDFSPADLSGLRMHTPDMTDALRVDPISGVNFKLVEGTGASGRARWLRSNETVAAEAYGDDFGVADNIIHGQYAARAWRGDSGGIAQSLLAANDEEDLDRQAYLSVLNAGANDANLNAAAGVVLGSGATRTRTLVNGLDQSSFLELLTLAKRRVTWGLNSLGWGGGTDISNTMTVTHGFSTTPVLVLATIVSTSRTSAIRVYDVGATTFKAVGRTANGSQPLGSDQDDFYWLAIG